MKYVSSLGGADAAIGDDVGFSRLAFLSPSWIIYHCAK